MKKHSRNNPRRILLAAIALNSLAFAAHAQTGQTITLHDYTGRGFAPDVVTYRVSSKNAARLRVADESGRLLASQLGNAQPKYSPRDEMVPPARGHAGEKEISFVTDLPPNGTHRFTIGKGGGAMPSTPVAARVEGESLTLSNGLLAVRVPKPTNRVFAAPVALSTLPAPILAFRSGAQGEFRGAGRWLSERPVKALRVTQSAGGPVLNRVTYEIDFAPSGFYRAQIEVADRVPLAKVTEEYDLGKLAQNEYWELDVTRGWSPDSVELMRIMGNGGYEAQSSTFADVVSKTVAAGGGGYGTGGSNSKPGPAGGDAWRVVRRLVPDSAWSGDLVSYLGLWNGAQQKAVPDGYEMAGVVPLHKGQWRRPNAWDVMSDGKQMAFRLPVGVVPMSWLREITSETSPFSMLEHDPILPATYGRREWGLQLAPVNLSLHSIHGDAPFYRARALYGIISLDRYKDYVLEWPDSKAAYPRVFLRPAALQAWRKNLAQSPLAAGVKQFYAVTGDDGQAQNNLVELKKRLAEITNYMTTTPAMGHHHSYTWIAALADDVLAWPKLSDADRHEIRARLALIAYLYAEPDTNSAGNGTHHGNPNMGVSRLSDRANFMALLPDHPMFKSWRDYFAAWEAYKMGQLTAPGGGWIEFGSAYYAHGFSKVTRGLEGLLAADALNSDALLNYAAPDWEYYLNLLTPFDSRYGARIIPGGANSPNGYSENLLEASGVFADKKPELAANLAWAWQQNGAPTRNLQADSFNAVMTRPDIAPKAPDLSSKIVPGVGVVFRAHPGPDETYMYFRSGYNWSHWYEDQGHFILYSKGAALVPGQPYQYYWPENKEFDLYNTIRFGHPENKVEFGWPDSNILDHAFGPTVDYAWSSSGYPAWFIKPGKAPGYGDPRKLADVPGQQEGDFHWNRQVMFLKGKTAQSPNYFVLRDTTEGKGRLASWLNLNLLGRKTDVATQGNRLAVKTEWPTKLDVVFANKANVAPEMVEDDEPSTATHPAFIGPPLTAAIQANAPLSPNWVRGDGKPVDAGNLPDRERHVIVRVAGEPGGEYFWLLYPRGANEASPIASQLAPGVMKVVTEESTDYVFLSTTPMKYSGEDVTFAGSSGAVRLWKDGRVTLSFCGGRGRIGYKNQTIEANAPLERTLAATEVIATASPAVNNDDAASQPVAQAVAGGVRFTNPRYEFVELTSGKLGVRGVGPFDLTITNDKISGTIEGDTRTIVVTKPDGIARPMYHVDGVLWAAGIPDDPSPYLNQAEPQFDLALGITAGRHSVEVSPWRWLETPPEPQRASLVSASASR